MLMVTRKPGERIVIVDGARRYLLTILKCQSEAGNTLAYARMHISGNVEESTVNVIAGNEWRPVADADVRVYVTEVQRNQAQIGVQAPREIIVDREEIYLKKQETLRRGKA